MRTRRARRLVAVAVIGTIGTLLASSSAPAAVITPNTQGDENGGGAGCSLREAILAANTDTAFGGCPAGDGADTVSLAAGRYGLSIPRGSTGDDKLDGDLWVASEVTITHAGIRPAVIDGGRLDRVIHVVGGGNLNASGLTITNGRTTSSGGGIRNEGALNLSNATVAANETTASFGGGIANSGTATMSLTNVTLSGNRAEGDGGGIDQGIGGLLNLNHVTIAGNTTDISGNTGGGGGIFNAGGTINLRSTIIARNHDRTSGPTPKSPDCGGAALTSQRHNLIGDLTGCTFVAMRGDKTKINPRLGPLANNGGSTLTRALLAGSPAIKAGGGGGGVPTDQRGVPRRGPDIGAYEFARCGRRVVNRVGSSGKDRLAGTSRGDGILGLGGRDILKGRAGRDGLCGGGGRDKLRGQGGSDTLIGGKGRDACKGGPGKDVQRSC
jgi:CSLREA domain-containing protein